MGNAQGSPFGGSPFFCVLQEVSCDDDDLIVSEVVEVGHELPEQLERLTLVVLAGIFLEDIQPDGIDRTILSHVRVDVEH